MEDKIYRIAKEELVNTKHLFNSMIVGVIGNIFHKANIPRTNPIPNSYIDVIKNVLCEEYNYGFEFEFEDDESYEFWNKLNNKHLKFITKKKQRYFSNGSPYADETIPFLIMEK